MYVIPRDLTHMRMRRDVLIPKGQERKRTREFRSRNDTRITRRERQEEERNPREIADRLEERNGNTCDGNTV